MEVFYSVLRGLIGIVFLLGIALLLSNNRKKINWRIPLGGIITAGVLINLVLHTTLGGMIFEYAGKAVDKFISYSFAGTKFVFGTVYTGGNQFAFIFIALIPLIFFSAFMSLLYHYGIIQKIISIISIFLIKVLKLSGVESMGICSNVLMGQSEGAITIGPYISRLTDSELFMLMTSGMSSVAGTLLYAYASMGANLKYVIAASLVSAPAAVVMAKIIFPETRTNESVISEESKALSIHSKNAIDALGHGAMNGATVAFAVGVMLLAFIAFVALLDGALGFVSFHHMSVEKLLGYIFSPIAFLIGVPLKDVNSFATLFGLKTCFNEILAYTTLKQHTLSDKSFMMLCFALTGFANFSSIAIQIGSYGAFYEGAKARIAKFGLKALAGAILANLLGAALAGMFFIAK